jgi:hypothetical protein
MMTTCCRHSVFAHKAIFDARGDYIGRGACAGMPSGYVGHPETGETVFVEADPCTCPQFKDAHEGEGE